MSGLLTPESIASGVAAFLAIVLGALGYSNGRRGGASGASVEVAGALIDGRQARDVTEALDRNTAALAENTAEKRRHRAALEANTQIMQRHFDVAYFGGRRG